MSEWQPIETAPKDGMMFLAHYDDDCGPRVGAMQWQGNPSRRDPDAGRFHSWTTLTQSVKATHWMPLPEPPE